MSWVPWCQLDAPLIIYVFWFLLCGVALSNVLFAIHAIRKTIKSSAPSDKLLIVIMLCFMTPGGLFAYSILQSLLCTSVLYHYVLPAIMGGFLYLIGLALIYCFYVHRLKKIFASTPYALSSCLYAIFILLFVVQLGALFSLCAIPFLLPRNKSSMGIGLNCYNIFVLTNFVGNMSILGLFMRKIYVLGCVFVNDTSALNIMYPYDNQDGPVTVTASSTTHSNSKSRENKQIRLKLKKLLNPAIRYVICACIAMLSSNLLSILGLYRSNPPSNDHGILYILHMVGITIDQSLNMCCLYLQYSFSARKYKKCCGVTHQCIFHAFVKRIQSTAVDKTETAPLSQEDDVYDHIANNTGMDADGKTSETTSFTTVGVTCSTAHHVPHIDGL